MDEKRELTGNDFIDAYNLGVDAGKQMSRVQYEDSRASWFDMYTQRNDAVNENERLKGEVAELKAEAARLESKVKKLKKKLKGGM
jgi:ubiquinone biosynthesis protein UbiJ